MERGWQDTKVALPSYALCQIIMNFQIKSEIYDKLIILSHLIASWTKAELKDDSDFNASISHKPLQSLLISVSR